MLQFYDLIEEELKHLPSQDSWEMGRFPQVYKKFQDVYILSFLQLSVSLGKFFSKNIVSFLRYGTPCNIRKKETVPKSDCKNLIKFKFN